MAGSCISVVLLLWDSWALVQLLHVSEQVEFALWPLFHLSLHLHSPYGKEKKHKTVSKASWGWGIFPELQMWGIPEALPSVNCDILIGGGWEVDVVDCQVYISLHNYISYMAGASLCVVAHLKIVWRFLRCAENPAWWEADTQTTLGRGGVLLFHATGWPALSHLGQK